MLGYSRDELLTMTANQIDPVWEGEVYQKFMKVLGVNTPQTLETTVIRKDGVAVPLRFVCEESGSGTDLYSVADAR